MADIRLDPIRFAVEHRNPEPGGGPTLRVCAAGRELLRFDCFDRGGHWHLDPDGRNVTTRFDDGVDPLEWTLAELRRDLGGWLARAGFSLEARLAPRDVESALLEVDLSLRNPPVDLDAVEPSSRRPSRGEKWGTYPEDVLPAWVADMDFPIAEPIRRVLRSAVERSDLGYPVHPAPTDVPEIVATRVEHRFGWRPDPGNVEILADVVQGMYVALQQFSEPGDGVIVQTPIYPPFLASVRRMERRAIENPLSWGARGYAVDIEGLRESARSGARLLLLCNPHNPSGRVFRREELEAIAEVALENDLTVVSDEIHADLVYAGHRHIPFASLSDEVAARTIALTAPSKAFNIAGLRCAVAIFGAAELKRRFCALPRHLRGGIGILGIESLRAAWRHGQPWLDQVLAYLQSNRDHLAEFVSGELHGIALHPPEATYLAWLDCRALSLEPDPYRFFLERGRVALSNGAAFGAVGRGFVRFNFATSRPILDAVLARMAEALRKRD
jgi:cystathionine beta-lyase